MIEASERIGENSAPSLCVILTDEADQRRLNVAAGSALRLRFRHSIYGSKVEEMFLLRRDGFELVELRYGEARLVEFYGHEHSRPENGGWIVKPAPFVVKVLHLHPSSEAMMSLHFDRLVEQPPIRSDTAYRLLVGPCDNNRNG